MAERIDHAITVWSKRVGLVLLGWFASSAYHGTLEAGRAVRAVPVLQAQVNCEDRRADKAAQVAKQAIAGAYNADLPLPSPKAIPRDCPHPLKAP